MYCCKVEIKTFFFFYCRFQVGDRLLVKSGSLLPADGVVVSGGSTVDESMVSRKMESGDIP